MRRHGPRVPMSQLDDDAVLAGDEALHSALASIPGVSVIVFDHELRIRALHGTALQRHGYVHELMIGQRTAEVHAAGGLGAAEPALRAGARRRDRHDPAALPGRRGGLRIDLQPRPARRPRRRRDDDVARHHGAEARAEAEARGGQRAGSQAILDHSPMAIYMRDRESAGSSPTPRRAGSSASGRGARRQPMAETFTPESSSSSPPTTAEVMASGEARASTSPSRCAHRQDAPRLVAEVPRPRRPRRGRRARRRLARRDRSRARGTRAGRGARALRDAFRLGPRRHAREPRYTRRHASTSSSATRPSRACSAGSPRSCSAASAPAIVHPGRHPDARRMLDDVLAGRPASGELRFKHRDGHDICALTRAEPHARPRRRAADRPAGGRHLGAQAPREPAAAPRRPRRADRALQPPALPGGARARGQPRAPPRPPGSAPAARPGRLQAGQRLASATRPATSSSRASASALRKHPARQRRRWRASAATSSP